MTTAIDTNVISSMWSREPLAPMASKQLGLARSQGGLVICPAVLVELLAYPGVTAKFVDEFLAATGIEVQFAMPESVWREAARAFSEYVTRRKKSGGGMPERLLSDFIIGAHALLEADCLFTLDRARYALYFPRLRLVDW